MSEPVGEADPGREWTRAFAGSPDVVLGIVLGTTACLLITNLT